MHGRSTCTPIMCEAQLKSPCLHRDVICSAVLINIRMFRYNLWVVKYNFGLGTDHGVFMTFGALATAAKSIVLHVLDIDVTYQQVSY